MLHGRFTFGRLAVLVAQVGSAAVVAWCVSVGLLWAMFPEIIKF